MYLLKRDYDHAIDLFPRIAAAFSKGYSCLLRALEGSMAGFRQGRTEVARKGFENQIALFPDSAEVPNALYWRARLAEEENNPAMARAFYKSFLIASAIITMRNCPSALKDLHRRSRDFSRYRQSGADCKYPLLDRVPPISTKGRLRR